MGIDEREWLGDSEADERRARVPKSAAGLAAQMQGARPFPAACVEVLNITNRDDYSPDAVARALENDAPLIVRILGLVNSSAFGLRVRCTSVRQACSLLGSGGIRSAVLAASALALFPGNKGAEWSILHDHAQRVAALARHLAPEWNIAAEEMFTTAFLHDIGKWVLLEVEPAYKRLIAERGKLYEGTLEGEREAFGFDHAELSEHMLTSWNIPQTVVRVVALHHSPADAYGGSQDVAKRVAVLRLADLLAHAMETEAALDFDALVRSEPLTYLGLSAQSLRERYEFLSQLDGGEALPAGAVPAPAKGGGRPRSPDGKKDQTCAYCDAVSFGAECPRCGAHLCDLHVPVHGQVCSACEAAFAERLQASALARPAVCGAIAVMGIAASLFTLRLMGRTWVAGVPAVASALVAMFGVWRRFQMRREFLGERR
jgi:putative nucleotidyltransferase with HDIG domain